MKGFDPSTSLPVVGDNNVENLSQLEPGVMPVQRREEFGVQDQGFNSPLIKVKVSHGSNQYDFSVSAESTFGNLKNIIAQEIGLEPKMQQILFRGKEKDDDEPLHMAGVKDNSKVLLLEDTSSKEKELEEVQETTKISKGVEAVWKVRSEVDKLAEQVSALEAVINSGSEVNEKDILYLSELLMRQLLNLDMIEAEGDGKVQRKLEVRRVQSIVETVDALKAKNSNPLSNNSNVTTVTTEWETFESGAGNLNAPLAAASSTVVTQEWEHFD